MLNQAHRPQFGGLMEGALFVTVGIATTLLSFTLYAVAIYWFGLSPPLAATFAYLILLPPHFAAYARLVFRFGDIDWRVVILYLMTLAVSFAINIALVRLYWGILQADPISAQVLALIPAVAANYILFKFVVFAKAPLNWRQIFRIGNALQLTTALVASAASYLSIVAILLFTTEILWADDWRHYNDYFFLRDLWGSIVGRQNGHLMIVPNILFMTNYAFLGGEMNLLAILNAALLTLVGFVLAATVDSALFEMRAPASNRVAAFSSIVSASLMLAAPVTQFWNMGIHNQCVVLGAAVGCAFCSGLLGNLNRWRTAAGFILSALLASTSFSTGSAVWALGFAGAVVMREKIAVLAAYFVGGILAAFITLGALSGRAAGTQLDDPLVLLTFLPAFLGNMPAEFIFGNQASETRLTAATIFGATGLFAFLVLTVRVYRRFSGRGDSSVDKVYTTLWLFCGFVILAGLLVAVGRSGGVHGDYMAIAPRFTTWSSAFWVALGAASIVAIHNVFQSPRLSYLPAGLMAVLCVLILALDISTIRDRVHHAFNFMIGHELQIVMDGSQRAPRGHVWEKSRSATVVQLINHLRDNDRNVFKYEWAKLYGVNAKEYFDRAGLFQCSGSFNIGATEREDEWRIRGIAWPRNRQMWSLEFAVAADPGGRIVGIAMPAFGHSTAAGPRNWTLSGLLGSVPFLRDWPGASGHLIGELRASPAPTRPDAKAFTWAGRDRAGRWCLIGS